MTSRLVIIATFLSYVSFGQTAISFKDSNFPDDKFTVKKEKRTLGTITVDIIHVKPNRQGDSKPFSCRTWLTINEKDRIVKELTEDMESVGGCSGLYFPDKQPSDDLIVVSKFGDYDGRLLIIDKKGMMRSCLGGKFYVSNDNKFLFSNYDSDLSGVSIVDLTKNEIIYTGELKQYLSDWYYQDGQYFAIVSEDVLMNGGIKQLIFDFKKKEFTEKRSNKIVDPKSKLKVFNDFIRAPDCSCGK